MKVKSREKGSVMTSSTKEATVATTSMMPELPSSAATNKQQQPCTRENDHHNNGPISTHPLLVSLYSAIRAKLRHRSRLPTAPPELAGIASHRPTRGQPAASQPASQPGRTERGHQPAKGRAAGPLAGPWEGGTPRWRVGGVYERTSLYLRGDGGRGCPRLPPSTRQYQPSCLPAHC